MEPISLHKIGTNVLLVVLCTFTTSVICTNDSFPCHKEVGLCGCVYQAKDGSKFSISLSGLNKEGDVP